MHADKISKIKGDSGDLLFLIPGNSIDEFLFSAPNVHVIESIHSKSSTLLILINNNDIKIIWMQMFGGIDREKPVYAEV